MGRLSRSVGLALAGVCALPACAWAQEPSAQAVATAEAFVDQVTQGDFAAAAAMFDETVAALMPAARLQEAWDGLVAAAGPFEQRTESRATHQQGYDIVLVTCRFGGGSVDLRVVLDGRGRVAGLQFVPTATSAEYQLPNYAHPDSYTEREVTVGEGEWALPGTLTMPVGQGPFPAVVLVHGSGPQDRDETIGPSKPFRDLAVGLASRGIGVLRYEKRTKEHGAEVAAMLDRLTAREETVDDALAAVALLRTTPGLDPQRLYVLGHSQGGTFAPRIGAADRQIAGLIIMAGAARPLEDLILEQLAYVLPQQIADPNEVAKQLAQVRAQVERVKSPDLTPDTPREELPLGIPAGFWLDVRDYRPAEVARELPQRLLVLQGGRDYQVTEADFALWEQALADRPNARLKLYPDLSHLFASGVGKATPTEYMTEAKHVAGEVIRDLAEWILEPAAAAAPPGGGRP